MRSWLKCNALFIIILCGLLGGVGCVNTRMVYSPCPRDKEKQLSSEEELDQLVLGVSAVPVGVDWYQRTILALSRINPKSLKGVHYIMLRHTYALGVREIDFYYYAETELLPSEKQAHNVKDITFILYEIQKIIGTQPDWDSMYHSLAERRPQMIEDLGIPDPCLSKNY